MAGGSSAPGGSSGDVNVLHTVVPARIERVLKEAPWSFGTPFTSRRSPLKEACKHFLDLQRASDGKTDPALVDAAVEALRLGCDSGVAKVCEPALDGLHKVVGSGLLTARTAAWVGGPTRKGGGGRSADRAADEDPPIDRRTAKAGELVAAVVRCGDVASSAVQLAVVGTLLGFATSPTFGLHGDALSHAMRTLLHVSIAAGVEADQITAKTALVQLINTVFKRAEPHLCEPPPETPTDATDPSGYPEPLSDALLLLVVLCQIVSKDLSLSSPTADAYRAHGKVLALDLLRQLLEGPSAGRWLATLHGPLRQPLGVALLRAAAGVGGVVPVDEGVFGPPTGAGANGDHRRWGDDRGAAENDGAASARSTHATGGGGVGSGGGGGHASAGRTISPAALKAASPLAALACVSFGTLVLRARATWKAEVAIMFPYLALAPLETDASPGAQLVALRLIRKLSSDPQVLVDLFVNYDCDMSAANLYERTVAALAGVMRPGAGAAQQVRNGAVQCMLAIVQSLRTWHARGECHASAAPSPTATNPTAAAPADREPNRPKDNQSTAAADAGVMELSPAASLDRNGSAAAMDAGEEAGRPAVGTHGAESESSVAGRESSEAGANTPGLDAARTREEEDAPPPPERASAVSVSVSTPPGANLPPLSESQRFQMAKAQKASVEAAVELFNRKPSVAALAGVGGLSATNPDPAAVAAFLRAAKGLDKTAIGELLGSHEGDALAVMHAFVSGFAFAGMDFDVALRHFLRKFRLPGEAQKIDRLMEAFAGRYCHCNPGVFSTPDAAYVLAFAVIMLNTDAHNPMMDTHMTREDFIAMATSTDEGGAMDLAMLGVIFDRVVADEIRMTDAAAEKPAPRGRPTDAGHVSARVTPAASAGHASASITTSAADVAAAAAKEAKEAAARAVESLAGTLNLATPWKRRDLAAEASAESEHVLRETRELFRGVSGEAINASTFFAASEPGLARPMLEAAATPLLRALEGAFNAAQDGAHAALPLEGARAALRLSAQLQIPHLRDALAAFLTSAPGIGRVDGMAPQGAEAVVTLLELATREKGTLGGCWAAVLEVVSRLDELHVAPRGARSGLFDDPDPFEGAVFDEKGTDASFASTEGAGVSGFEREASGEGNFTRGETTGGARGGAGERSRVGECVGTPRDVGRVHGVRSPLRMLGATAAAGAAEGEKGTSGAGASVGRSEGAGAWTADVHRSTTSPKTVGGSTPGVTPTPRMNAAEAELARWLSGQGADVVDRVFTESVRLDSEEIVVYAASLADVARTELWNTDGSPAVPARTYSLRRLAEVVAINMERVRLVWSRIWHAASSTLVAAAAHPDPIVARCAVRGIRTVAMRLLRRAAATGTVAAGQADAIRPLLEAMTAASGSAVTRRLVVETLGEALAKFGQSLGGGWGAALDALSLAANDPAPEVGRAAFDAAVQPVVAAVRGALVGGDGGLGGERHLGGGAGGLGGEGDVTVTINGEGEGEGEGWSTEGRQRRPSCTGALQRDGRGLPRAMLSTAVSAVGAFCRSPGLVAEAAATLREIATDAGAQLALVESLGGGVGAGVTSADSGATSADASSRAEAAAVTWRSALECLARVAAGDDPESESSAPRNKGDGVPVNTHMQPALESLFGALAAFPEGLPRSAWTDAAAVAVTPLLDLAGRRETLLEKFTSVAAPDGRRPGDLRAAAAAAAAEWCAARAQHVLVPLCRLCASSRSARSALLRPLLDVLPEMASADHADLAAHAVCAARHVAAVLSAAATAAGSVPEAFVASVTPGSSPVRPKAPQRAPGLDGEDADAAQEGVDDPGLDWAWNGAVCALAAAAASASEEKINGGRGDTHAAGAVAALLGVRAAAEILSTSPPSSTPWRVRVALLDILAAAYEAARKTNRHPPARLIRLEVTAGELLLEALEAELREAAGSEGRMPPEVRRRRVDELDARLRAHVVAVLVVAAEGASSDNTKSSDVPDDDGGSEWLARSASERSARAFREPLAAAALDAIADMNAEAMAAAVRAAMPSIVGLVAVGRHPVSGALYNLFAGPLNVTREHAKNG